MHKPQSMPALLRQPAPRITAARWLWESETSQRAAPSAAARDGRDVIDIVCSPGSRSTAKKSQVWRWCWGHSGHTSVSCSAAAAWGLSGRGLSIATHQDSIHCIHILLSITQKDQLALIFLGWYGYKLLADSKSSTDIWIWFGYDISKCAITFRI